MNGFGDAFGFEAPVDRAIGLKYPNLRDACPICGRVLIEGKCLNCGIRPYDH
jgi:hypothetical protein